MFFFDVAKPFNYILGVKVNISRKNLQLAEYFLVCIPTRFHFNVYYRPGKEGGNSPRMGKFRKPSVVNFGVLNSNIPQFAELVYHVGLIRDTDGHCFCL